VVIGNVLQRIGDAFNEIGLLDDGHGGSPETVIINRPSPCIAGLF
jgi:hypothetical protein